MKLQQVKETILESSLGYALWSGSVNGPKLDAIRRMIDRAGKTAPKVLDIGCGPGTSAALFADEGYLGIDYNPQYIADASRKFPAKRFEVGDATKLALNGEKFDIVLINSLMHHLNDEECLSLLAGIDPVLADGCSVIVQEPLTPEGNRPLMTFFMNQDRGDYFRPLDGWKGIFTSNDYQIVADDTYFLKLANLMVAWQMYVALIEKQSA